MSRTERAVCSLGCIVAMLVLWWSFSAQPGWALWVRIGAVLLVPAVFFGVICAQMIRAVTREEAGLTKEQIRERRRAAREAVQRDAFPLLSRLDLYVRPLQQLWELKKHTDTPPPDPNRDPNRDPKS